MKKLFGKWEPKEGVLYRSKSAGYERRLGYSVDIITECYINGSWAPCSFMLKKGEYHIFLSKNKRLVIEKKYVKVRKVKIESGVGEVWLRNGAHFGAPILEIHYQLTVLDSSKLKSQ
ncbi:hypothetical protein [Saccharolobus islandicus]|uniref:hypothetical protein n=1 Tax=Saccharolobus islandicus TaxID=43080 RepID=UPI0011D0E6FE|nr:hypothetical protein [Sulfolobus islandicus]